MRTLRAYVQAAWVLLLLTTGIFLPVVAAQDIQFDFIGTVQASTSCQWDAAQFQISVEQVIFDQGSTLTPGAQVWVFVSWGPSGNPSVDVNVGDRVEISGWYLSSSICAASLATEPSGIKELPSQAQLTVDVYTDRGGRGPYEPCGIYYVGEPVFSFFVDLSTASDVTRTATWSNGQVSPTTDTYYQRPAGTSTVGGFMPEDSDVGTVTVQVIATSGGQSASDSCSFEVRPPTPPQLPLSITISANPTSGQAPLAVSFSSTVTGGTGNYPTYAWDFGDYSYGSSPNPSHRYQATGAYYASLTVTDSSGSTAKSNTVVIEVRTRKSQCPTLESIQVTYLHDFAGVGDFWDYVYKGNVIPYFVDDRVDVSLSSETGISSVKLELQNASPSTISMSRVGQGSYSTTIQLYEITRPQAAVNAFFWVISTFLGPDILSSDFTEPDYATQPPPIISQVAVTLNDGTVCSLEANKSFPDVRSGVESIDGWWTQTASPTDLLIEDSNGRRVGSVYQNGVFMQDVDEIPGALYTGHAIHPQLAYLPSTLGNFIVDVTGTGDGTYHLNTFVFKAGQKSMRSDSGTVSAGETLRYNINLSGGTAELQREERPQNRSTGMEWVPYVAIFVIAIVVILLFVGRSRGKGRVVTTTHLCPRVKEVRSTVGGPRVKSIQEMERRPRVLRVEDE